MNRLYATLLILLLPLGSVAQNADTKTVDTTARIAEATNFTIPSSPAFTLLDVNPAKVTRPASVRDFKLDILVKDNAIISDLAVSAKPIQLIFYNNQSTKAYKKMKWGQRTLSTLDLSVGTAEKDEQKKLAVSGKVTLFRPNPLDDESYLNKINSMLKPDKLQIKERRKHAVEVMKITKEIKSVNEDTLLSAREKKSAIAAFNKKKAEINDVHDIYLESLGEILAKKRDAVVKRYLADNWNASALDIGAGYLWSYDNPDLDSIKLVSRGYGIWINGAFGPSTKSKGKWLFTGMFKYIKLLSSEEYFLGGNIRYGSSSFNVFFEYVYEDIASVKQTTLSYGGEYRLDATRTIEFGLRKELESDFSFRDLTPRVKLNWNLMDNIF